LPPSAGRLVMPNAPDVIAGSRPSAALSGLHSPDA
jgi:hypothetical protein